MGGKHRKTQNNSGKHIKHVKQDRPMGIEKHRKTKEKDRKNSNKTGPWSLNKTEKHRKTQKKSNKTDPGGQKNTEKHRSLKHIENTQGKQIKRSNKTGPERKS